MPTSPPQPTQRKHWIWKPPPPLSYCCNCGNCVQLLCSFSPDFLIWTFLSPRAGKLGRRPRSARASAPCLLLSYCEDKTHKKKHKKTNQTSLALIWSCEEEEGEVFYSPVAPKVLAGVSPGCFCPWIQQLFRVDVCRGGGQSTVGQLHRWPEEEETVRTPPGTSTVGQWFSGVGKAPPSHQSRSWRGCRLLTLKSRRWCPRRPSPSSPRHPEACGRDSAPGPSWGRPLRTGQTRWLGGRGRKGRSRRRGWRRSAGRRRSDSEVSSEWTHP